MEVSPIAFREDYSLESGHRIAALINRKSGDSFIVGDTDPPVFLPASTLERQGKGMISQKTIGGEETNGSREKGSGADSSPVSYTYFGVHVQTASLGR